MKPIPVAFSLLERFVNCPKQFHDVKVSHEFEDPPNESSLWGDRVHTGFKEYLQSGGTITLPDELATYKGYLDNILRQPGQMYVEEKMAVDTSLNPCDFFRKDCFLRGVVDVMHIKGDRASALDHKTGKRKTSYQMKMMALLIFLIHKQVNTCRVAFMWLKTGEPDSDTFTRDDIPKLWEAIIDDIKQYKQAFERDIWQPRQSGLCHGWCPVKTCQYWKPRSPSSLRK